MIFKMKKRVVGVLTTMVVLVAGTAMGGQPCLSIGKVSYNGPEASRYLEAGVARMVENRLKEAGVVIAESCGDGSLAISVTLFGGTANLGASVEKMGYHFSRSGSEAELIGFVQMLADEVAGVVTKGAAPAPAPTVDQAETAPVPASVQPDEALRSDVFPLEVQSVAVGDIDGDGSMEAVAASRGLLQVLSISKDAISETNRVDVPGYMKPVRLDMLDFDNDGKSELLLTALHAASQTPLSVVYRYNGSTLVPMGKEARFLTAVVTLPDGSGRACIGQRIDGIDYWGYLYRVVLGEGGLELDEPLAMDDAFKVLGWDNAPLQNGQGRGFFRLSDHGRLEFWSDAKTRVLIGEENYGGSLVYLSKEEGSRKREARRYLVSRVQAVDGASLKGVGVLQAEDALGSLFQGLRRYKSGRVVVVGWNGYELAPVAATPSFKGFLSDFCIADVDGDGKPEAFCSVVSSRGGFSGKGRSYFLMSPLK